MNPIPVTVTKDGIYKTIDYGGWSLITTRKVPSRAYVGSLSTGVLTCAGLSVAGLATAGLIALSGGAFLAVAIPAGFVAVSKVKKEIKKRKQQQQQQQ